MKKIRVAFISQPFEYIAPPQIDGSIAIWTDRVVRALANDPLQFVVYAQKYHGQPAYERFTNVEYRRVQLRLDIQFGRVLKLAERVSGYPFPKRPFFSNSLSYLEYGSQIAQDIRSLKSDVVHIHNFSQFVPLVRRFNPNVKIVLHMGCDWLVQLDPKMIEPRLRLVDKIIGCSRYVAEQVAQMYPQHAHKCTVIYNGVDQEQFIDNGKRRTGDKKLLFVGRVSPEKGIHTLVEAFKQILVVHPDARLDIVGPIGSASFEYIVGISDEHRVASLSRFYKGRLRRDNYGPSLQHLISPDLADKVRFVGMVPHDRVVEYYQHARILINPSLSEAFGMSLIEAMACGMPVVATRVGGMKEIVGEKEVGLLVEPDDPDALANAVNTLLGNEQMCKQMGVVGRRQARERYGWDKIGKELMFQYHQQVSYGR